MCLLCVTTSKYIITDGYVESSPKLPYSKHLFVVSEHGDQSIVEQHGKVFKIHGK